MRGNFTHKKEEQVVVDKILEREGIEGCRIFVPTIALAMREWASPEFNEQFLGSMPPPVRTALEEFFLPEYMNMVHTNAPCSPTGGKAIVGILVFGSFLDGWF